MMRSHRDWLAGLMSTSMRATPSSSTLLGLASGFALRPLSSPHRLDCVGVDNLPVAVPLFCVVRSEDQYNLLQLMEALGLGLLVVDQPHLFEDGRLSRLSSSKQEHFDFIPHARPVLFELFLNLHVPCPSQSLHRASKCQTGTYSAWQLHLQWIVRNPS